MSFETLVAAAEAEEKRPGFGAGKEPGEQGTIEWLQERVGYVTASRFKDVLDFTKAGKSSAKRTAYLWEIVVERLTGQPSQHFASTAMQHGTEWEPMARMAYSAQGGHFVAETGFLKHPEAIMVGGSPDGLIDEAGGLEIKCPFNAAVHLQTILGGMPEDHTAQIQGLMWVTGRLWFDFVSFCPSLPSEFRLYVQRISRDPEFIVNLAIKVAEFRAEIDLLVSQLKASIK